MIYTELLIATEILTRRGCYEINRNIKRVNLTIAKQAESIRQRLLHQVLVAVEAYDNWRKVTIECSGDLLCERTGIRHKDGCIGRTEPFSVYAKGLGSSK